MSRILFIKTSSLGDVIHHMPAVTDARAHLPDAHLAWAVEEAFAPLVRLHPAVNEVIPVAVRRWRGSMLTRSTWSEVAAMRGAFAGHRHDAIVDTQGLIKSALLARVARGRRHGYDAASIREPMASRFYDVRHRVAWQQHAIARNRALSGLALGYRVEGEPDYGLDRAQMVPSDRVPYAVLLHATARAEKQWPEQHWKALAATLGDEMELVVPGGTEAEQARSVRIAQGISGARLLPRQPLDAMARLIAGASFVIGVDTGLMHLAAALRVPLVAIFVASEPGLTGPIGTGPMAVLGAKGAPPSLDEVRAGLASVRASAQPLG